MLCRAIKVQAKTHVLLLCKPCWDIRHHQSLVFLWLCLTKGSTQLKFHKKRFVGDDFFFWKFLHTNLCLESCIFVIAFFDQKQHLWWCAPDLYVGISDQSIHWLLLLHDLLGKLHHLSSLKQKMKLIEINLIRKSIKTHLINKSTTM